MKKMIIVLFSLALILPTSAMAQITALKGKESYNGYEIHAGVWEKVKGSDKIFLVIDADLGTPHFTVNDVVVIYYWTQWKDGQKFKYYERTSLINFLLADIEIADLGKINKKRKVAFCLGAEFNEPDLNVDVKLLGHLIGERNKTGYIKYLKGNYFSQVYDSDSGEFLSLEKARWEIYRTKDFTGSSAEEMADNIETYLEGKGYEEKP